MPCCAVLCCVLRPSDVQVLVVCPTQELCMQVLRTARSLVPSVKGLAYPVVGEWEHQ